MTNEAKKRWKLIWAIVGGIATILSIFVFVTGKNLPDFWITNPIPADVLSGNSPWSLYGTEIEDLHAGKNFEDKKVNNYSVMFGDNKVEVTRVYGDPRINIQNLRFYDDDINGDWFDASKYGISCEVLFTPEFRKYTPTGFSTSLYNLDNGTSLQNGYSVNNYYQFNLPELLKKGRYKAGLSYGLVDQDYTSHNFELFFDFTVN